MSNVCRRPGLGLRSGLFLLALVGLGLVAGCRPDYAMKPPQAFKRYDRTSDFRYITADGLKLQAREQENYPRADLPFWTDALKRHLSERGYVLKAERCFRTDEGLPGCTLENVVPHGDEDWVMSVTLYVEGDKIFIVEVAGPYERYAALEGDLRESLKTFEPEGAE